MHDRDDDIDRLLRESAERWRSTPLPLPNVDESLFVDRPSVAPSVRVVRWLSAAAAFAVLGLVAAIALSTALPNPRSGGVSGLTPPPTPIIPSPSSFTSPSSTPTAIPTGTPIQSSDPVDGVPALVANGDTIVAYGNLFETATPSEALMCRWADGWPPDVGCLGSVVVEVHGVDVRDLPGTEADPNVPDLPAGTWVTYYVRVEGVWQGDFIDATNVEAAERPASRELLALPAVPCARPPGGWPGYPDDPEVAREAEEDLRSEVSEHSDKYAGISYAVSTDVDGRINELVAVVGTLVDVGSVEPKLRSIYPFNLCILRLEHSHSQLQQVANDVIASNPDWEVMVDTAVGRVGLYVPVFDQAAADAVAPYSSAVLVRPLVVRFLD